MSADHATTDGLREAVIDALYKADSIISWMLHRRASRLSDEDRQQLAEAMSALAKIDGHRNYRAALAAHPVPSDAEDEREHQDCGPDPISDGMDPLFDLDATILDHLHAQEGNA